MEIGESSLSAGDTNIRLPGFSELNSDLDSSDVFTKVLELKENPYASAHGNSTVQGNVVTIILARPDGSEISVQNTSKPISIRLNRPVDKQPKAQEHQLYGTTFQYHKVNLIDKQMTLSVSLLPDSSSSDVYAVYVSFGTNETILEPPTESKFDLVFVLPNDSISITDMNFEDEYEVRHTIFMPPSVHLGNGTYIFGVKILSKSSFSKEILLIKYKYSDSSTAMNLTEYNSSYTMNMYVSKCQYWNEKQFVWSTDGCQVSIIISPRNLQ